MKTIELIEKLRSAGCHIETAFPGSSRVCDWHHRTLFHVREFQEADDIIDLREGSETEHLARLRTCIRVKDLGSINTKDIPSKNLNRIRIMYEGGKLCALDFVMQV